MQIETYPWMIPVPLRRAGFEALTPDLVGCNLEVDLGAIGPFGVGARREPERIGWADLQRCPIASSRGRLGSGRAAHVDGRYLKGLGRTSLALNWHWRSDCYHHSGHMLVSAAVRELLVSRWLEAFGAGDTIVACDGLLVADLDPALASFAEVAFERVSLAPADLGCQAISSKPGGFIRASNLLWLLDDLGREDAGARMRRFFMLLDQGLGGDARATLTPDAIVERLEAVFDRSAANFRRFVQLGVYWGSFVNNWTLDGRFLDLEVCTVFQRPTAGLLVQRQGPTLAVRRCDLRQFVGFDVIHVFEGLRAFAERLRARLAELRDGARPAGAALREFLAQLVARLDARLEDPGSWFASARWREEVLAGLEAALPIERAQRAELERLVDLRLRWTDDPLAEIGEFVLHPLAVPSPEPGMQPGLYLPARLASLVADDDRCEDFARAHAAVVAEREPGRILARLREPRGLR